jgi:phosphoserine phosphatase RsbU/P
VDNPLDTKVYRWPLEFMTRERFRKGETLFRKGDGAQKMFYISSGSIRLPEVNRLIVAGEVLGEIGLFSPSKQRTASAICEEDVEAFTMGQDEVVRLLQRDPDLATSLIQLSIRRFMDNLAAETAARERIESELRIAHDIQTSMLPRAFPSAPQFQVFALMDPAKEVGGDFYDFFPIDPKHYCFTVGDVCGKGVPAALFMAITKTLLKSEALRGLSPAQILDRVNQTLCQENQACLFVTIFCCILNLETGELECGNAGHNPPVTCGSGGDLGFLNFSGGPVVGVIEDARYENRVLHLKPGELLLLYTDGVTEAMNSIQEQFSERRLLEELHTVREQDPKTMAHAVRDSVRRFVERAPQSDDITLLAVRFRGAQE